MSTQPPSVPSKLGSAATVNHLHYVGHVVRNVPNSALDSVLPGEVSPELPAFVAYGLAVQAPSATRDVVERSGFPVRSSPVGGLFVPASAALGAAIIFHGL